MCLLSVAWQSSDDYPFVFVGNRDEFHARASAAADWWNDAPDVFGGRDLVAGGSWLGINRDGRFAVVTNRPDLPAPDDTDLALSRGDLVSDWLTEPAATATESFSTADLGKRSQRYGGFSLLVADNVMEGPDGGFRLCSGGNGTEKLLATILQPGITGLSNTAPGDPWPKLVWLNQQLDALIKAGGAADPAALLELLLREEPVPGADTDWVSARPFIVGDDYGTRSASVITVDQQGECRFIERRFGPGGVRAGETAERFSLSAG